MFYRVKGFLVNSQIIFKMIDTNNYKLVWLGLEGQKGKAV